MDIRASVLIFLVGLPAVAAPPRPAGVARGWESWPQWAYLEAGSAAFRARLDDAWGGLDVLGRGQLNELAVGVGANSAFAATYQAVHGAIDDARPMRLVVGHDAAGYPAWAMVFATRPGAPATLPAICRAPGNTYYASSEPLDPDRPCARCELAGGAIVCGVEPAARALRDDYVARGLTAGGATAVHAEQVSRSGARVVRAVLDASEAGGALHATIVATPLRPPAGSLTAAALAAASRVEPTSARVETGAFSAYDTDLESPLQYDGTAAVFVEAPVATVVRHLEAYWRALRGNGLVTRFAAEAVPRGFPAGTRRFRRREWITDSGAILQCTPRQMGGCTVVGHRPPTTTLSNDLDVLVVPADGGTWIVEGAPGDRDGLAARQRWFAAAPAAPPPWSLPAVAVGKLTAPHGRLWWVQRTRDTGELVTEILGQPR